MSTKTGNFIRAIENGAFALWTVYGVLPSVAIAQAALESEWGTSGLAVNYKNLFGIKGNYGGNSQAMETWENYGGVNYNIVDSFRVYPDWETSIKDYGVFLNVNSRYKKAIGVTNYRDQIREIHVAGYATDPDYQTKIISIIEANGLVAYDKAVFGVKEEKPKKGDVIESILYLPNGQIWTVYDEGSDYKTGWVVSTEAAAPDSGLYLKVLGDKGNNILIVDLPDFGQKAIYFDKDKGAKVEQKIAE